MALHPSNPGLSSLFLTPSTLQALAGSANTFGVGFCQQSGCNSVANKGAYCLSHGTPSPSHSGRAVNVNVNVNVGGGVEQRRNSKEGLQLPKCTFHGCSSPSMAGGLCSQHQQRLCIVEDCFAKATNSSIYCGSHEQKFTKACAVAACKQRLGVDEANPLCYAHRAAPMQLNAATRKRRLSVSTGAEKFVQDVQETRKESAQQTGAGKRQWSHPENVFLTGVVFEHMLTDSNKTRLWETVKEDYDLAWKRFVALNPQSRLELCPRSLTDLKTQFRCLVAQNALGGLISFAHLICDWELKFNVNGCLLDFSKLRVSEQQLLEFYALPAGWSVVDDIFLVAAVVDKFLKTGEIGEDHASWALIKSTFDSYLYVYSVCATMANSACNFVPREVSSLFERFKLLKNLRFVKFCYSQWKSTYQSLVFVTMLQLQASSFPLPATTTAANPQPTTNNCNVAAAKVGIGMPSRLNNASPSAVTMGGMSLSPANVAQNDPAKQASLVKRRRSQQNSLLHLLEEAVKVEDKPKKKARRQASGGKRNGEAKGRKEGEKGNKEKEMKEEEKLGKEKRNRWKEEDETSLWKGIAEHGNSWSAISQVYLPGRTHHQVKDKGKRLLRGEGWITGRSRESSIQACDRAKQIALRVLGKQGLLPANVEQIQRSTQQGRPGLQPPLPQTQTTPSTSRVYPVVAPMRMLNGAGNG